MEKQSTITENRKGTNYHEIPKKKVVGAIYTNGVSTIKNPYIEALPEILSYDDFMKEIASFPSIPMDIYIKSPEERRSFLSEINNIFYQWIICIISMIYYIGQL